MSIASRITTIEGHIEDAYTEISRLGVDLTNVDKNIDNIADKLQDVYSNLPSVSGEGSSLSLSPTRKGGLAITLEGACEQDGTPTPDSPQDIRVVTGNNSVVVQNKNLANFVETQKGWIDYNTSVTSTNFLGFDGFVKVKGNTTYTVSFEHDIAGAVLLATYVDKSNNLIQSAVTIGTVRSFTTPQNTDKVACWLYKSGGFGAIGGWVQLEVGSTATEYVAHAKQTYTLHLGIEYLTGIGDYKDEIVGKTDEWKIRRKVQKLIFNGTNNWQSSSYAKTFYTNVSNGAYDNYEINCKSNLTKNFASSLTQFDNFDNGIVLQISGNNHYLAFMHGFDNFSVDDFKAWLNTTNLILYVKLSTPTETPITDQTLITDLNNMYQAMGYDGTTNIAITSNSANAQMEANISALKGE